MRQTGNSIRILILIAWPVLAVPALAADERVSGFSSGDTVTIRSAEAWEGEEPNIIHFSGNFELRASDWYLSADLATLYGKLDDPETAVLTGSPAFILVSTKSQGRIQEVLGEAERIVYHRETNSIRMEGAASLTRDGNTMSSGEIEYDIEQDRIHAGGNEGVYIKVKPED
jgi:lipopolysaccharide transport protein LptA